MTKDMTIKCTRTQACMSSLSAFQVSNGTALFSVGSERYTILIKTVE